MDQNFLTNISSCESDLFPVSDDPLSSLFILTLKILACQIGEYNEISVHYLRNNKPNELFLHDDMTCFLRVWYHITDLRRLYSSTKFSKL